MKTANILATGLASVASASPSPAKVEARQASSTGSGALPTITTKGNAFWAGDQRFYIRGVDYQPGGSSHESDPLADPTVCNRDIPYFKQLGLNTIRVYAVDNSKSHDECMAALAAAGIYLALDVNTSKYSINRDKPAPSYNAEYLQSVFATIDSFAAYSNTLLFFSGNEVINTPQNTNTAPYVKAVTRDMKQYIGERGYRAIPVGYSAADVAENQYAMAQYMDCGEDPSRGDFYAINNYEWCDPSSFEESGWQGQVTLYQNYSKPLFLSEYGCIKPGPRTFGESTALYQPDMTGVFSGGLVYEYAQEANGFGLYEVNGDSVTPVGQQPTLLGKAFNSTTSPSGDGGYSSDNGPQDCPGPSDNWKISPWSASALPAMPSGATKYLSQGAGAGPGLGGDGSQDAGPVVTETAGANAGAITATLGNGPTSTPSGGAGSDAASSASSSSLAVPLSAVHTSLKPLMACGAVLVGSFVFGLAVY